MDLNSLRHIVCIMCVQMMRKMKNKLHVKVVLLVA